MKRFLGIFVPIGVILIGAIGALTWVKSQVRQNGGKTSSGHVELVVGAQMPEFKFKRLDGATVEGGGDTTAWIGSKKVILVNFWATWCEACMEEMPSIIEAYQKYQSQGFEVVAVNVDDEPGSAVSSASKQFKFPFPIYTDLDGKLSDQFDVHAIPSSTIIDSNRVVLFHETGERDWMSQATQRMIEEWLKK